MEFLLIASAHFLALLSPGPDFFLILQAALRLPTRCGIAVCTGIALGNALYLLLAVSGLEVIRDMGWLMTLLRYFGAAYLIFLGFLLLRAPRQSFGEEKSGDILGTTHRGKQFGVGFLSAVLNPKNAIFYLSLFTVMVAPETDLVRRGLYAVWMTLVVFFWDAALVMTIGTRGIHDRLGKTIFWVEKVSGLMLTIFGMYLPFS